MKRSALFSSLALLLTPALASAAPGPQSNCNGPLSFLCCSLRPAQTNLALLDADVAALAAQSQFARTARFHAEAGRVAALADAKEKLAAYQGWIGVRSPAELVQFVGARDEQRARYQHAAEGALQLDGRQAARLVSTMARALVSSRLSAR